MRKFRGENLQGKIFGEWLVISDSPVRQIKKKQYEYMWMCRCSCGSEKSILAYNLKEGKTKSCGCVKYFGKMNPNWRGYEEIPSSYWTSLQWGATDRNIEFSIEISVAYEIFLKQNKICIYTGLPISFVDKTASLDRIDSSEPYTINNCQWVHKDVNLMKNHFSESVFLKYCNQIASHTK